MEKQYITHEKGNEDAWICKCGNTPSGDGFFPCNEKGIEIEPVEGSDWEGTYVCNRCGLIVDQNTLEVIGKRKTLEEALGR